MSFVNQLLPVFNEFNYFDSSLKEKKRNVIKTTAKLNPCLVQGQSL